MRSGLTGFRFLSCGKISYATTLEKIKPHQGFSVLLYSDRLGSGLQINLINGDVTLNAEEPSRVNYISNLIRTLDVRNLIGRVSKIE